MITSLASEIKATQVYFEINNLCQKMNLYLKIEGLNIAQSIKLKTAIYLLDSLETKFNISSHKHTIIESSSGNLGVALSILCKERGYSFICVTDPNISQHNENLMRCYGANVIKVQERDENGGYLKTRIKHITKLINNNNNIIWTNQYDNQFNIQAHYETTAPEILDEIKHIDYLFIGAGTTGTLMGCIRYFKKYSPQTIIIAVDTMGSVTFDGLPKKRYIPGLGTSLKPGISNVEKVDNVMLIEEVLAIKTAHFILKNYGLLLGGSSASVIEAIRKYDFTNNNMINVVAICPDLGDKYLETIYNPSWIKEKFNLALEI